LGLLIALLAAEPARAQNWYELNLHGGAFNADNPENVEDDTDGLIGARMMLQYGSGWAWGGNFDWIPSNADFDGEDFDVNMYLYSLGLEYMFPASGPTRFFVGSGIGAATTKVSDVPEPIEDSETNLLIPVGGGVKWYNGAPSTATWALRGEVRDNIIFVDNGDDSEATNNFEFSGGISFIF
ncbi:MAG: outer membrane beta-barrel protein, partial [Gemmatimonadota bacterium]